MTIAFVTGITGQDGYFLAKWLLNKGYQVFGFSPHSSIDANPETKDILEQVSHLRGSIEKQQDIIDALKIAKPDEIYHLASQSHPGKSWQAVESSFRINGMGAVKLFEAVKQACPDVKLCHASSSEIFGRPIASPQNEQTPHAPVSPYAAAKAYAHQLGCIYREAYHLFISNSILFNHESERRPLHFVTQKVAYGAACAALGILESPAKNETGDPIVCDGRLALGNLDVTRDWGYAPDFVRAMWLMLQQNKADDFIIGTGKPQTLRRLCEIAYSSVGKNWEEHVYSDIRFMRPLESSILVADSSKAQQMLGWEPSIDFQTMVEKMVLAQISSLRLSVNK